MSVPKKKTIPRRTYIPITLDDRYIAQPDAIAQTVYPITKKREIAQKQYTSQKQQEKQAKEAQNRKRKAWKAKKNEENTRGKSFSVNHYFMTDQQIDQAIAAEERLANGPRFEQGQEKPSYNLNQLASQYSNLQSFYNALGSPNIMPMHEYQVRMNPGVASAQIDFGLNNPALTAIQMSAPTGPGAGSLNAAKSAFKVGMRSSKPMVTRVATSFGKGVQAGGRALVNNAPKVAANVGVQAFPLAAAAQAYSGPTVNQDEGWWDANKGWVIPTALLAGTGVGVGSYKYIKGKGAKPVQAANLYKYSPDKKWFTWERPTEWERSTRGSLYKDILEGLGSEWNAAVGDATKEAAFKNKYGLNRQTTKGRKKVDTPWSNQEVSRALQQNQLDGWKGITNPEDFVLIGPTNNQVMQARARNLGRATLGVGAPVGGYFLFRSLSLPTTDARPVVSPQVILQSNEEVNPVKPDSVKLVPRTEVGPVTTSTQEELDSINDAWAAEW